MKPRSALLRVSGQKEAEKRKFSQMILNRDLRGWDVMFQLSGTDEDIQTRGRGGVSRAAQSRMRLRKKCNCLCVCHDDTGGLLTFLSGLHKKDKSLPTLNVLSRLHNPPHTNPLCIHTRPLWIRADLFTVDLTASQTKKQLWKHFILWQNFN